MSSIPAVPIALAQTAGAIASRNQLESPFFRLPPEIRNHIYEFVFDVARIVSEDPTVATTSHNLQFRYWDGWNWLPLAHLLRVTTVSREFRTETHHYPLELNAIEVALSRITDLAQRLPGAIRTNVFELHLQTGSLSVWNNETDDEDQWLSDVPKLIALMAFDRLEMVVLTSPWSATEPKVIEIWVEEMIEKYAGKHVEAFHA